eukprot:COSAG05_NODE_3253_length_2201_cov_32.697431_2_plen_60_part_01
MLDPKSNVHVTCGMEDYETETEKDNQLQLAPFTCIACTSVCTGYVHVELDRPLVSCLIVF